MASQGTTRGGRRGRGRPVVTRQSKHLQGLPPEEQPDLDAVKRVAREGKNAAREKEAAESLSVTESAVEDQPAVNPESQGTPAVCDAHGSQGGSSDVETSDVVETTACEGSDEVSEGDTAMVESPEVIDLRSASTSSEKSVAEVKPEPRHADEEVPSTVKSEDVPSEDAQMKSGDSLKIPSDDSGRADSLDGERAMKYVRREF
ncbi:hypothetical protein V7S43_007413 [Phytophthora oleae]|uniref:Uncharacterized protein n=1 Tax=Phytophthora oleae TaxID=2107226 RepID=A0ABD3FLW0_9STRA